MKQVIEKISDHQVHCSSTHNEQDKEPKYPPTVNRHTHTHTWMLFSHEKYGYSDIRKNMDGLRGTYAKWNKSDRERQILHKLLCRI